MVRVKDATFSVKKHWVSTYGDDGFYLDEVYEAILMTYKKEPTKTTYSILKQHLTESGYQSALLLIEVYCKKRIGVGYRFRGERGCGRSF